MNLDFPTQDRGYIPRHSASHIRGIEHRHNNIDFFNCELLFF